MTTTDPHALLDEMKERLAESHTDASHATIIENMERVVDDAPHAYAALTAVLDLAESLHRGGESDMETGKRVESEPVYMSGCADVEAARLIRVTITDALSDRP